MSLLDRFRPRWKHADPQVRRAAVEALDEAGVLAQIFRTDPSSEVRLAAFARIRDEQFLAEVAMGGSELNLRAAERLTDQKRLGEVARHATSAGVRAAVVGRLEDEQLLQRIASLDVDPEVRRRARQRHEGPDRFRDYLRTMLSQLQIAQRKADRVAEFCGTLDDVCGALVANSRYRINGIVTDADQTITAAAGAGSGCIELLAGRRDDGGVGAPERGERVVYRIRIWRQGENDFSGAVEERRYEMSSNTTAWSDSSKSE